MQTSVNTINLSDTALMIAYRDGDTESFDELYRRHRKPLYRYVASSCEQAATAAELFQDIWTRVIDARHGYSESAPFQAWLYRIARNRMIDHYRANRKINETTTFDATIETQITQIQTPLQPDEITDLLNRENALDEALSSLPTDQRDAVLLRHIAGFSVKEIASIIDENTETVKSRLRYAFTKLRKQLRATG